MPFVLVTGEHGFIGAGFRNFSKYREVRFVSLRNKTPESIYLSGVDTVLHLAALVHDRGKIHSDEYFRINRDLTVNLANSAKSAGVKHFIFMSSIKVYGEFIEGSKPWNEFSECNPEDNYGRSKLEAEKELKKLEDASFCVSIIRTPVVYGPGMKANMHMLMKLVSFMPLLPFGEIENKRCYTYIKNLVGFIDRIIELKVSGIFIAMDNTCSSTTELVHFMAESLKKNVILFKPPQFLMNFLNRFFPESTRRLFGSIKLDNNYTRNLLSFNPPYTTREGIREMTTITRK
jgi:nucleoside-diphosphate-sugar epimerase